MKKIMMMALAGLAFFSAEAQNNNTKGCKMVTKSRKAHHDKYAENFSVCKNDQVYHICGEQVTYKNSTKPTYMPAAAPQQMSYTAPNMDMQNNDQENQASLSMAPQSQSYPSAFVVNTMGAYEGYYPKHYITVSYTDNVADENRAPYEGLPSPAYDGPDKNKERNLNESNPNANLAPITGRN